MSAQKRKRDPSPTPNTATTNKPDTIFPSAPIHDRESTFTAYYSPTLTPSTLQSLPEIQDASHKILAWRRESNQQSLKAGQTNYVSGRDDDGEKYAGKKVEKVLEGMGVVGACVVARWYGGVLLGPVRFTHIETCAREAVMKWMEFEGEARAKRRKVEEEVVEKGRLVRVLGERDGSVAVLRQMAAEKEGQLKLKKDGAGTEVVDEVGKKDVSAVKAAVDYSTMGVEHLRKLEKARDATLAFLLKRIDKAEAELATLSKVADNEKPEPP